MLPAPPHLLIDGFLGAARVRELLEFAVGKRAEFVESGFYSGTEPARVDRSVRRCEHLLELGPVRQWFSEAIDAVLERATRELGTERLTAPKKEIEMVWNGDGGLFKRHTDAPRQPDGRDSVRALTFVYYFHRAPKMFDGGELRLYPLFSGAPGEGALDIEPLCDRLVAFPAFFPHEVLPTRCASADFVDGRFSINCWLRRRRVEG